MNTHQLFPLLVARENITLKQDYKEALIKSITEMRASKPQRNSAGSAWTGDTHGEEQLLADKQFGKLREEIAKSLYKYLGQLEINIHAINLYCQRSWATYTQANEKIAFHTHAQSHISFAYYLQKPANTGGIMFNTLEHQNEIAPGIFNTDTHNLGLIKKVNAFNGRQVLFDPAEGEIVIFPSKASHGTVPNQAGQARISISGDIVLTLKDSTGFEHLMPNIRHWQKL